MIYLYERYKVMKKKGIIISIIAVLVIVLGIYALTCPKVLGNMDHSYSEQITSNSEVSFSGEAGDKIKFSFRSNIEKGVLDILLHDSEGNLVYQLDDQKELETFFTLDNTATYILTAKHSNFVGKYKVKICKMN